MSPECIDQPGSDRALLTRNKPNAAKSVPQRGSNALPRARLRAGCRAGRWAALALAFVGMGWHLRAAEELEPSTEPIEVTGIVLDEVGAPVPDAQLFIHSAH